MTDGFTDGSTLSVDGREISRDLALMQWHVEALYTHDDVGRIVRVREHNGARAPRYFLGRTDAGVVCRCRDDVAAAECIALHDLAATDPVDLAAEVASEGRAVDVARYADLLGSASPVAKVWGGPAYRFPSSIPDVRVRDDADAGIVLVTDSNADLLRPLLATWLPDVHQSPPLMAYVVDGEAVAVCGSVRITAKVQEAGVETAAPFRGRGLAPAVVAAWARTVRAGGAQPLYSTAWSNTASRTVARKLALVLYGTDLNIS